MPDTPMRWLYVAIGLLLCVAGALAVGAAVTLGVEEEGALVVLLLVLVALFLSSLGGACCAMTPDRADSVVKA